MVEVVALTSVVDAVVVVVGAVIVVLHGGVAAGGIHVVVNVVTAAGLARLVPHSGEIGKHIGNILEKIDNKFISMISLWCSISNVRPTEYYNVMIWTSSARPFRCLDKSYLERRNTSYSASKE